MNISFQYYPAHVRSNTPIGMVSLERFLSAQKNPKPEIRSVFAEIEKADKEGDKAKKAQLKQNNLFYFTPCVTVKGYRRYENIESFTGLLVLDFDKVDNATELRDHLFNSYRQIVASWVSPSRRGVKCLVRIPVVTSTTEFKAYFFGITLEMEKYDGFDGACQNCVLPLFQSYDPDLRSRKYHDTWTTKGEKKNDLDNVPPSPPPNIITTEKDKETCIKMINTGFDRIGEYGHPPLRSLCLAVGGYIAAGYISEREAVQLIAYRIDTHHYLKKDPHGYKSTARWAIDTGMRKPLILNRTQ